MIRNRFQGWRVQNLRRSVFYQFGVFSRISRAFLKLPTLLTRSSQSKKANLMKLLDIGYSNILQSCDPKPELAHWMTNLNNETRVSMLSIPGTHNSSTYHCSGWFKFCFISQCQSLQIRDQLRSGIRFFDLRVTVKGSSTIVNHKAINYHYLQTILEQISKFLKQHPSEFVILSFQADNGKVSQANIMDLLRKHRIDSVFTKKIPKVYELRGKAWIFQGYNIAFQSQTFPFYGKHGIQNEQTVYVQNYYAFNKQMSLSRKTEHVLHTAFQVDNRPHRIKVNFLSANIKSFLDCFRGPFPSVIVLEEEGPNFKLNEQLKIRPKIVLGVTVMDFPGEELISRIVNSNSFL